MKIFVLALMLGLKPLICLAHDFDGTWVGEGREISAGKEQKVVSELLIEIDSYELRVNECWQPVADRTDNRCIQNTYSLENETTIIKYGEKIGDISPDQIMLFEGSGQMSEQLIFQMKPDGLHYRYMYGNLDGVSIYREIVFQRP